MSKLELDLPIDLTDSEARLFLAIGLYAGGRVTLAEAASSIGMSNPDFLLALERCQREIPRTVLPDIADLATAKVEKSGQASFRLITFGGGGAQPGVNLNSAATLLDLVDETDDSA